MPPSISSRGLSLDVSQYLHANIGFLKHDPKFEEEEPYAFRYVADVPIPLTNMEMQFLSVPIHDIRGQEHKAKLQTCGFEVRKLRSNMSYEQFSSQKCIDTIYARDLRNQLIEDYSAIDVDFARIRVSYWCGWVTGATNITPLLCFA